MTIRLLAACAVLAAGAAPARADLACLAPAAAAPGMVRSGVPLKHRFVVSNGGTGAIDLGPLRPGCGCLAPRIDRTRLEPGESANIDVEVNTVTQAAGRNTWRVTVPYRDGAEGGEMHLTLSAEIEPVVSIEPATLVVHTATAFSHRLTLTERTEAPLAITHAATASPHVRVSCGAPERSGGAWRRTVRLDILATCPEGRLDDVLCLYSPDAVFAELRFPFAVVKRSPGVTSAAPAAVRLTAAGAQPLPARIVLLSRADDGPVAVDRVEVDQPTIRCTWAAGPDRRATLRVSVERAALPALPFRGKVRVHLKGAAAPLEVPVSVD